MSILDREIALQELAMKIDNMHDENAINALNGKIKEIKSNLYNNLTEWDKVLLARHPKRPTSLDYIEYIFDDFMEFHGDKLFYDDGAIVGGIATLDGVPITFVGQQKGRDTEENIKRNFGMPYPEGYRKALRLMKQADKFNRPIVTFIDTAGANPGLGAEERGQGEAIARNLMEMSTLKVPVVAIVIGEGGSGGALALGVANRVYMLENSVYSILSPEGYATILWKDASKASEAAEIMKLSASSLREFGIIEGIIPEGEAPAHINFEQTADNMKLFIKNAINELKQISGKDLVNERYEKFRKIGEFKRYGK